MIDIEKARELVKQMNNLLTAVQATGGYKYRAMVRVTDRELEGYVAGAAASIRGMALRLMAAEYVLSTWGHRAEYEVTVGDLDRGLKAPDPAKKQTPPPVPPRPRIANRRTRRHPPPGKSAA